MSLLADARLYQFMGGDAPSLDELRKRYEGWSKRGSRDGRERWLNWVIRQKSDIRSLGTVQATVITDKGRLLADMGWIVGTEHQGKGYATEAAQALVVWLFDCGVEEIVAHVHPAHVASGRVASKIGMEQTEEWLLGERRWRRSRNSPHNP